MTYLAFEEGLVFWMKSYIYVQSSDCWHVEYMVFGCVLIVEKPFPLKILLVELCNMFVAFLSQRLLTYHVDRSWIWSTTSTTCIGWQSSAQFPYLPLSWAQKSLVLNCCLWSLLYQRTGGLVCFSFGVSFHSSTLTVFWTYVPKCFYLLQSAQHQV